MKILDRIKLIFNRNIDDYFKKGNRVFVPMVKGGMWVDHDTALTLSAVFSAVRYISETVASLPWELRERIRGGGNKAAVGHNVYHLLHTRPNPYLSSFDWRVLMLSRVNLWGNAYAEIERDKMNRPLALWPIEPERVQPKMDDEVGYYYEVTQQNNIKVIIYPENMFHIRGLGDEKEGYSVVSLAARSIGAGLAADEFMASFYENSAVSSGVITHPKALSDKAYERLKNDFKEKHSGPKKAWEPLFLEEDMKWAPTTMPMKDAQLLESRKFTVSEVARWFRVTPHKIGDLERSTYSNIEHQSIEVVQDTIIPWAKRIEGEADYKLISSRARDRFYSKVNVNGLLRGDSTARRESYRILRNIGAINVNEIRELEDMNPIGPEGDIYVMQTQYTTLENIMNEEPKTMIEAVNPAIEKKEEEETKAAWQHVFNDALERIYMRKRNRIEDAEKNMTKDKLEAWLEKFQQDHNQYMVKILRPVFLGYAKAVKIEDAGALEICLQNIKDIENYKADYSKDDLWDMASEIMEQINTITGVQNAVARTS
jgi:HK97 family phage portal protein